MSNTINAQFGVEAVILASRVTKENKFMARVIQEFSNEISADVVRLTGGNKNGAWAIERGEVSNPISLNIRELPDAIYTAIVDAAETVVAAEASGNMGTLANIVGTSVLNPTTGIASIAADSDNLEKIPTGQLTFKAVTATTVDIYLAGKLGEGSVYLDENGKVAEAITIADTGATVDVPNIGITITSGSGTIAMVADDIAYSEVRGVHNGVVETVVGGNTKLNEYELWLILPEMSDGSFAYYYYPRVSFTNNIPLLAASREFAETTLEGEALEDCNNVLYKKVRIKPDTTC